MPVSSKLCLACLIQEKSRFSSIKRLYKILWDTYESFVSLPVINSLAQYDKDKDIYTLCKFRTTNHKLPIETGRWNGIDRENMCLKCSLYHQKCA
jgi:hypothetical protein